MTNKVLLIGNWYYQKHSFSEPWSHIFTGVLNEDISSDRVFKAAFSFGTDSAFDFDNKSLEKPATTIALVPITQEAANTYVDLLSAFKKLEAQGRLPFYFSRDGWANRRMHQNKAGEVGQILDLEGEVQADPLSRYDYVLDAYGERVEKVDDAWDGHQIKVPASCLTLNQFVLQRAGIDLSILDGRAWEMKRGHEVSAAIREIDQRVTGFRVPGVHNVTFRRLVSESGHVAWCLRETAREIKEPKDFETVSSMFNAARQFSGGVSKLLEQFSGLQPFSMCPRVMPKYVQDELDQLEHCKPLSA